MTKVPTPAQTVGPFFTIGLRSLGRADSHSAEISADEIRVSGRVLDGDGIGVNDALIELWHADASGRCGGFAEAQENAESACAQFLRVPTDERGGFSFQTIKPGRVAGPDGKLQAPHIVVILFMRGLLRYLVTRIYFPDESTNAEDPIWALVPEARRASLLLKKVTPGANHYEWNVGLQGANETVFFDW
jgi:protocatechuate 3,4-dioxygenase, alpha subunit